MAGPGLSGAVTGIARDAVTVMPVPGVKIQVLTADNCPVCTVETGSGGEYRVSPLEPARYNLLARAAGYGYDLVGVAVSAGGGAEADLFLLPFAGEIAGAAMDASSGVRLADASVRIYDSLGAFVTAVLPGTDGLFHVPGLAPDNYRLIVSAPGHQVIRIGIAVAANANKVARADLALAPGNGLIGGTVSSIAGEPVPSALVTVYSQDDVPVAAALSDDNGCYVTTGLPPGSYKAVASAPGYAYGWMGAIVTGNASVTTDLFLAPTAGTVAGSVRDAHGAPLVATVTVFTTAGLILATQLTDGAGSFSLTGLPPGGYCLQAHAAGYATTAVGFSVAAGQTTRIEATLSTTNAALTGIVQTAGRPVAGAAVRAFDERGRPLGLSLTGPDGRYVLDDLPAGPVHLVASAPDLVAAVTIYVLKAGVRSTHSLELLSGSVSILQRVGGRLGGSAACAQMRVTEDAGRYLFTVLANEEGFFWLRWTPLDHPMSWTWQVM